MSSVSAHHIFLCLSKIHKGLVPLKERPVVYGVDSLNENRGIYIDQILILFVQTLPSFVKDTDLLQRLSSFSAQGV